MDDNVGKYYVEEGVVRDSKLMGVLDRGDGVMLYDVIRIISGIPLFFEDHFERIKRSFQDIGCECKIRASEMIEQIYKIVDANDNRNCNIKFIMFPSNGTTKSIGYISKSYYPTKEEVDRGVAVGTYSLERKNPNIKVVDFCYKERINRIKKEKGYFEVFLVDKEGNVNEGGTSNIFFIKGEKIYTPPEEKILKGITRMHVIESCKDAGWAVIEEPIPFHDISKSDAVFLSGTSPKVLAVSSIDDLEYSSARNTIVNAIKRIFDAKIEKYITEREE